MSVLIPHVGISKWDASFNKIYIEHKRRSQSKYDQNRQVDQCTTFARNRRLQNGIHVEGTNELHVLLPYAV